MYMCIYTHIHKQVDAHKNMCLLPCIRAFSSTHASFASACFCMQVHRYAGIFCSRALQAVHYKQRFALILLCAAGSITGLAYNCVHFSKSPVSVSSPPPSWRPSLLAASCRQCDGTNVMVVDLKSLLTQTDQAQGSPPSHPEQPASRTLFFFTFFPARKKKLPRNSRIRFLHESPKHSRLLDVHGDDYMQSQPKHTCKSQLHVHTPTYAPTRIFFLSLTWSTGGCSAAAAAGLAASAPPGARCPPCLHQSPAAPRR